MAKRKRLLGEKIDFGHMTYAPANEQGVVFLFGILHEKLDIFVESIQTGFPDCVAKRRLGKDKWEVLRIEFEYESRSFLRHGHDITGADVVVCYRHNAPELEEHLEIIDLSTVLRDVQEGKEVVEHERKPSKLSAYQQFCQLKRLEGVSMAEAARIWRERRRLNTQSPPPPGAGHRRDRPVALRDFCRPNSSSTAQRSIGASTRRGEDTRKGEVPRLVWETRFMRGHARVPKVHTRVAEVLPSEEDTIISQCATSERVDKRGGK